MERRSRKGRARVCLIVDGKEEEKKVRAIGDAVLAEVGKG